MTPLALSSFFQVVFGSLLIIPVLILWVVAVVDIVRRGESGWRIAGLLLLVLILPILGPILYFVFRPPPKASAETLHMAEQDMRREAAHRPVGGTGMWR